MKSGILKLAEKVWNVDLIIAESVRKSQQELFQIAFNDIWLFMKNLLTLLGIHIEKPRVNFHSKKATATIATVSEKETYFIPESAMLIRPLNEVTNQQYRIATAPPIIYNTLRPDPDDCIREALEFFLIELFGYDHFNSGQLDIVKAALARQDVIGILPTGSGKSLCYQLSGLLQPCISFIVAPLISLIQDQKFNLDSFSIVRTAAIASHNTSEANKAFLDDFGDGRYQFVWISPERFMIKSFRAKLNKIAKRNYYGYAVIDEAHCISEWGHDFRISYLTLANTIRNYCPGAKLIGLTATASENVLTDICAELNLSLDSVRAGSEMDRPELHYHFIRCENNDERRQRLLMELSSLNERYERNLHENIFETTGEDTIAGIIFANTRGNYRQQNGCDDINAFLRRNGYAHGRTFFAPREGEKDNRAEIQKAFLNNEFPFIIATKAFGMGVNKKNIRYTIHFGLPWSIESFYQEAGRAGRDKEKDNHSDNYILYIPERDESAEKMISVLENPNSHIENIMSEQLTGDLNSIVWLWLQNNRPVDQQLKTIMEIYHFLLSGKTRFSLRDFHYSQFECDSALHKLMLVGYIIDWTYDYGTNTYDVTSTNEWTRYVAERKIKEYLSKFKAVNTFEKSELYHEYLNSDSGALLSKLMRALLIWIDENIIASPIKPCAVYAA
ncbi:MAG: RecQ family ATP-dependent DNA helicase [Fusobacteriaceae bacterium]|nr:RecQ family ATP-dependent DNA helicase [Fusobacteriaceae bacterium]